MKEITGKKRIKSNNLPKMLKLETKSIHNHNKIAEEMNKFFTNVGPNLANKIPNIKKNV